MVLDWESEKLVRKREKEKTRWRNFSRKDAYEREYESNGRERVRERGGRGREDRDRYCLHDVYEPYYERYEKPKLRRARKLEKHNLWWDGRRY